MTDLAAVGPYYQSTPMGADHVAQGEFSIEIHDSFTCFCNARGNELYVANFCWWAGLICFSGVEALYSLK